MDDILTEIEARITAAWKRYGEFASSHEAMGVALEEWTEFCDAVRDNNFSQIEHEAMDLAAVMIRVARAARFGGAFAARSVK